MVSAPSRSLQFSDSNLPVPDGNRGIRKPGKTCELKSEGYAIISPKTRPENFWKIQEYIPNSCFLPRTCVLLYWVAQDGIKIAPLAQLYIPGPPTAIVPIYPRGVISKTCMRKDTPICRLHSCRRWGHALQYRCKVPDIMLGVVSGTRFSFLLLTTNRSVDGTVQINQAKKRIWLHLRSTLSNNEAGIAAGLCARIYSGKFDCRSPGDLPARYAGRPALFVSNR